MSLVKCIGKLNSGKAKLFNPAEIAELAQLATNPDGGKAAIDALLNRAESDREAIVTLIMARMGSDTVIPAEPPRAKPEIPAPQKAAVEAPVAPVELNPIEARVAELRKNTGNIQNKRLDKLVERFQNREIDIDRLTAELDTLEAQAFPPDKGGDGVMFSREASVTSREKLNMAIEQWAGVVDSFLAKTLDLTKAHTLFPSTPASMQVLGLPDLPVKIGKHALSYANIRLTSQEMKALPEMLADPQLVYLHEGRDGEMSLNFVLDSGGYNGAHVVALQPNKTGKSELDVHYVATLLNVRPESIAREVREGRGVYQGNVSTPLIKAAFQEAKVKNGRESAGLRELMSRRFGLSTTLPRVMYRTDLVKMIDAGKARFSEDEASGGQDATTLRDTMRKLFVNPALFDKRVTVVQSEADLPAEHKDDSADSWTRTVRSGLYEIRTGKVYLIADNIKPGRELGVFLHEVGGHMGMRNLLGKVNFDALYNQINTWAESGGSVENTLAQAALSRVLNAGVTSEAEVKEELIAYFVEEAVNSGINPTAVGKIPKGMQQWFISLWNAVKSAVRKLGINPETLTAQDVVDLAYGSAKLELNGSQFDIDAAQDASGRPATSVMFVEPRPASSRAYASRTSGSPQNYVSALADAAAKVTTNPIGWFKTHGLGWLTLEQMVDVVKTSSIKAYADVLHKMQSKSKELVYKAALIDQEWAKLRPDEQVKLSSIMRAATRAQFDPDVETAATPEQSAIAAQWIGASTATKGVYRAVRDHYDASFDERKTILLDAAKAGKTAGKNTAEVQRMFAKMKGPYFPLMRMGKWYSVGMSPKLKALIDKRAEGTADERELAEIDKLRKDPTQYVTRSHESRRQAVQSAEDLRAEFGESRYNVAEEHIGREMAAVPDIAKIEAYLNEDMPSGMRSQMREIMSQMYFDMLPDSSALKRQMKREGVAGEDEDMRRVFAASAVSSAHHISRLKYANDLSVAMVNVRADGRKGETERMVANELAKRNELALGRNDAPQWVDRAMQVSYFTHLGLSPAYVLTNMSQVPMITIPWLGARHGFAASGRAIATAYADTVKMIRDSYKAEGALAEFNWRGEYPEGSPEHDLFMRLLERNKLDITIEHDITAVADMSNTKLDRYIKLANVPVRVTEMANRAVTALAAYRLEMLKSKNHELAVNHAVKAVTETQLDYSALNSPRHMQSVMGSKAIARLMFQFRKYQQGMIWLVAKSVYDARKDASPEVRREARRTLYGLFATTGMMAGAVGLPFAGSLAWLATAIGQAFDDDDDPFDAETELRNWLTDMYGTEVATVLTKGLPTLVNIDLSKRVGMGDIGTPLPFVRDGKTGTDQVNNVVGALAGPAVGMVGTTLDGIHMISEGDVAKGIEKIVPLKVAQNLVRTYRYNDEGMTDSRGEVVLPDDKFSAWDLAMRAAGFSTGTESTYYEANSAIQTAKTAATTVRNNLLRDFAQARIAGEPTDSISEAIAEFNARHPQNGLRITASSKLKAIQQRRKMARERNSAGVRINSVTRPFEDDARFADE